MCKWDDTIIVPVPLPARLSYTGRDRVALKAVDRCIAPIVSALNAAGVNTLSSCCGHDGRDGEIDLADGRTLVVRRRWNTRDGKEVKP